MTPNTEAGPGPFSTGCRRCSRLAAFLDQVRNEFPGYHCAPVPPFGDPAARLLVVGLAPGMHGANATGRPFTGDHAGIILYDTLYRFGFATGPESRSADDGLRLLDCRITNAVKCLPPQNKPSTEEVQTCNPYLAAELTGLPAGSLVLALGTLAHAAVLRALGLKPAAFPFAHGAEHRITPRLRLLDSYHCSRYNTQTRRLTEPMFHGIFARARALLP
jgi:uracil-DNA glycosylase family 4